MQDKPKILILDDDEDIQLLLQHQLSNENFECFSAYNEQEAIKLLGEHTFLYGLFDIVLSSTASSDQVIYYLQSDEAGANKHLPLYVMSAHMSDDYAKKVRLKGSNIIATFKKPLQDNVIVEAFKGNKDNAILLVEDDPDMAKLIKRELEKNNFVAYPVRHTEQAIALLRNTSFFGAIVDNQLEGETSQDVFDFLSNEGLHLNLPLILTGTKTRRDLEDDSFLFVFDQISKPCKKEDFSRSLQNLQQWQQSAVQNQQQDDLSPEDLLASLNFDDEEVSEHASTSSQQEQGATDSVGSSTDHPQDGTVRITGHQELHDDFKQTIKGSPEQLEEDIIKIKSGPSSEENNDPWQIKSLEQQQDQDEEEGEEDFNKRNHIGLTPIMVACLKGDMDTVEYLIEQGAELGLRCKAGRSCLHYAARSTNTDLVRFLLEKGIKVNTRDQENREPLYDAIALKRVDNVKALLEAGSRTATRFEGKNYLTIAVLSGDPEIVTIMLEEGLSPTFEDYKGRSPLDYATKLKDPHIHQLINSYLAGK